MLNHADAIIRADRRITTRYNKFKKHFRRVRPGKNPAEMLLQHDDARPHTSLRAREHITKMGWTVLPHPPYSPDLAPSDFHLFGSLKNALRGTRFEDDDSVIEAVMKWLRRWEKSWYRQRIHALVPGWRKAVQIDGDYVENSVCKRNIHLYCHKISPF
jgi:histone-lysine N-methyltransferase SETMAR